MKHDQTHPTRSGGRNSQFRLVLMAATVMAGGAAMGAAAVLVTRERPAPALPVAQMPAPPVAASDTTQADPKTFIQSAERARARGDNASAVRDLERARALRASQLGLPSDPAGDASLAYVSLASGAAPVASRITPRVLVTASGPGQRPGVAPPVYAGADLGQDAPDPLAVPPSLRPGARPTPLAPGKAVPPPAAPQGVAPATTATRPSATADSLNAKQLAGSGSISSTPLEAPPVAAKPLVEAGAAPSYPGIDTPTLPPAQRYQPQLQEYLPKYRPAPAPEPIAIAAAGAPTSTGAAMPSMEMTAGGRSDLALGGEPDPILRDIDRSIVELRDSLAPAVQGGFGYRWVSGDKGLSHLVDETIPFEAVYTPNESGQIKVSVTREYLNSGTFTSRSDLGLQTFGTIALGLSKPFVVGSTYIPPAYSGQRPVDQHAEGVGLNISYRDELLNGDIGTTPLGFKVQNVVGGFEVTPRLTDRLRLRVGGARRAVNESLLSYAGTTDPRTGATWGGVVHDRGVVALEYGDSDLIAYVSGGGGQLTGKHVANNTEYGGAGGVSYPAWRGETDEVRIGVDMLYEAYAKNLGFFTYGQGGYFSPQRYFSALVPVTYRGKIGDDTTYEVTTALGLQDFAQKASPYYPKDGNLQAQLEAMLPVGGLSSSFKRKTVSGLAANLRGRFESRVTSNLRVGGQFAYQHSGPYDEAMGTVYARYIFNGTAK